MRIRVFALFSLGLLALSAIPMFPQEQHSSDAPTRNPAAMNTLQKALDAMGGRAAWSTAKSARMSISIPAADGSAQQRTLQYDWSLAELRTRLSLGSGGTGKSIVSDPLHSPVTFYRNSKGKQERGKTVWLPDELPGVALYLALSDPRWEITAAIPTIRHPEARISIRRRLRGLPDVETQQDWTFDSTTDMPTSVISYTPTVSHSGLFLEIRTDYQGFSSASGLMTPTAVEKRYGQSPPIKESFQSTEFGRGLTQAAFDVRGDTAQ
jgi:hypothetical protein